MKINEQEKIYQIALSSIKGIGSILFKQLLEQFGSAENVFTNNKEVSKIPNIRKTIVNSLIKKDTLSIAEQLFKKHMLKNIQIICYGEESYPTRLKEIPNSPPILYCSSSNKINFNVSKVVSIVGTRGATVYGKEMVKKLIESLNVYNVLIISGLAYGIDIYAHTAAIQHNLPTIGVLAGGLDAIYPFHHTKIAMEMMQKGGIISEQAMGIQPEKHHFPLRNRIIAGMSDASIIIEANKKSGALITANFANQYNREVFAVPGCVGKSCSEGCNNLIKKQQAHLLTSVDDIAFIMNWEKADKKNQTNSDIKFDGLQLTKEEKYTIKTLAELHASVDISLLSKRTKIDSARLSSIALELELKNLVEVTAGNKYRLKVA